MKLDFAGQTAVVTGAARGIGLAISRLLHEAGARVEGWDLRPSADPCFARFRRVDVSDEASVNGAAAAAGEVDVLVNNAGVNGPTKPAWEYTLAEWNAVLAVDLTGVFLCSRALIPGMRGRGYGRIVNIASIAGKEGNPDAIAYGAAKAGVVGVTKTLARELARSGVLVNCITPSMAETPFLEGMSAEYVADRRARIPMGRFAHIDEIAAMTVFAASPACSFTTGMAFDVSGGRADY
ncbi:MAG: SDR family NAD(P)-dependent oxidoreductase [Spirochaetaceae bacterium]|nr:SDR family NAD(P)-dependent oxidoreductase [Spirochaetaceae bacterium]MDE0227405.1 SDR family NAD(P)-dependent oxidoreductase [Spirochaetaceae bacterium]MDE0448225.1 SDR family NAD(P)-dependent oxidoreductase [Spirochaetaceae bacterium]